MGSDRADIGYKRREQVVEAASAIIAEKGIAKLSLSAIEKRTQMARGHLTHYFPYRDPSVCQILDHMIGTMRRRGGGTDCMPIGPWPLIEHLLGMIWLAPLNPVFGPLQSTLLAQTRLPEDF